MNDDERNYSTADYPGGRPARLVGSHELTDSIGRSLRLRQVCQVFWGWPKAAASAVEALLEASDQGLWVTQDGSSWPDEVRAQQCAILTAHPEILEKLLEGTARRAMHRYPGVPGAIGAVVVEFEEPQLQGAVDAVVDALAGYYDQSRGLFESRARIHRAPIDPQDPGSPREVTIEVINDSEESEDELRRASSERQQTIPGRPSYRR